MIATRNRLVVLFAYAAAASAGFACTAILASKDSVQRCGTADDCDSTGDPRYVAECRFDPEHSDLDTTQVDKICVATFRVVGCGYTEGDTSNPLGAAVDMYGGVDRYTPCPNDADAPKGCPPPGGFQCMAGLSVNENGVCDDGMDEMPAYRLDTAMYPAQDIVDAYCQSFFCEGDWVCDRTDDTCRRCDPDLPIGEGGCGTVYIAGAPSCIYPGAALECGDGDTDIDEPRFGACP